MCQSDGRDGQVVGDGMLTTAKHVKQGDLGGTQDGVHARRAEEPAAQESEHPYER